MFNIYQPKIHLDRANNLLSESRPENFYYACLELRFCIEAIIYLHVSKAFESFTPRYINEWKPNKLISKLCKLEPLFQDETQLEIKLSNDINAEDVPWLKLGSQKLPKIRWLNKNYNKLGNVLHICQPNKAIENSDELAPPFDLKAIIHDLSKLVESNLILTFSEYIKHKCNSCNEDTLLTKYFLSNNTHFDCDNQNCSAKYSVTRIDENNFKLVIYDVDEFKCPSCNHINFIPLNKIEKGYGFYCQCGEKYKFFLALTKCSDS